ncbi:MAG: hypothetical protein WCI85_11900 [Comamonadaceae bacterium]
MQILVGIDKLLQIFPLCTKQWVNNGAVARIQFLLLFPLILGSAWAQPAARPQTTASQGLTEQRRVELRQALKAQRAQELPDNTRNAAAAAPPRHLSTQERADLRRQLRAQRPATEPERP